MRLTISIDPLLPLLRRKPRLPALVQAVTVLERNNAGIDVVLPNEGDTERMRELVKLREAIYGPVTVRIPPLREALQRAFELRPQRVVCSLMSADGSCSSIDLGVEKFDWNEVTGHAHAHSMPIFLRSDLTLDAVKKAAKLKFDGLEIDAGTRVDTPISGTAKFADFALSCWKMGLDLQVETIPDGDLLNEIGSTNGTSGVVMRTGFWELCIVSGIERTLEGVRDALR